MIVAGNLLPGIRSKNVDSQSRPVDGIRIALPTDPNQPVGQLDQRKTFSQHASPNPFSPHGFDAGARRVPHPLSAPSRASRPAVSRPVTLWGSGKRSCDPTDFR